MEDVLAAAVVDAATGWLWAVVDATVGNIIL